MSSRFNEFDCNRLKTYQVGRQQRKVEVTDAGVPWKPSGSITEFVSSLPDILAGGDFKTVVNEISAAAKDHRPIILAMGAHVIKCGLSPILIDLISRGIITGLALNGAGAIHDIEIALFGRTSEDVVAALKEGSFGMGAETAQFLNSAAILGKSEGLGFGESIGRKLIEDNVPHISSSIFATASRMEIPATVHVAMGTDIVHMHPGVDGGAIGDCSMRDFRIFASTIEDLAQRGGVLINAGSAVILPEVVLKSFAMAANVGCSFEKVFTLNLDFIRHYRSEQQIVNRVRALGGRAVSLIGHHEIMLPLLAAAVIESLQEV